MVHFLSKFVRKAYYGAEGSLTTDELFVLDGFADSLESGSAKIVREQIAAIDLVKREAGSRLTQFMFDPRQKSSLRRVPNKRDLFAASLLKSESRADILFSDGFLVGIEFNFAGRMSSRFDSGEFVKLCDLDQVEDVPSSQEVSSKVGVILGIPVREALPPALLEYRIAFLRRLFCRPPADFLEVLDTSDSLESDDFFFEGTQSRTVPFPEKTLQSLAVHRKEARMLCIEDQPEAEDLYIYDLKDKAMKPAGTSFREGLQGLLKA